MSILFRISYDGYGFNIEKLGVIISEYYVNLYGTSDSILNKGLDTDRFLAEWRIRNKPKNIRTKELKDWTSDALVNSTYRNKNGWLVCKKPRLNLKVKRLFVEVPSDIMSLKKADLKLARDWRLKTRLIFTSYFRKGYIINHFLSREIDGHRRSFYVLNG